MKPGGEAWGESKARTSGLGFHGIEKDRFMIYFGIGTHRAVSSPWDEWE